MDTRAGAISETEAVTSLDEARKLAGHSNTRTTLGYVRDDGLDTSRKVADARKKMRR